MNYADIKFIDTINGKGLRVSLFVSGCTLNCQDCFNKEAQNFNYGKKFTIEEHNKILETLSNPNIRYSGLSILGGEPFDNVKIDDTILNLIKDIKLQLPNKDIWIWSGYTFEKLYQDEKCREVLSYTDILIDGRFIVSMKDLKLKYRGSFNQRVIDVNKTIKSGIITTIL